MFVTATGDYYDATKAALTLTTTFLQYVPSTLAKVDAEDMERAEIVQNGEYDVVILSENMQATLGSEVYALFVEAYGSDQVLTWTVEEKDNTNYVYAYPFVAGDTETQLANNKTKATRTSFELLIASEPQNIWMCNKLYEHSNYNGTRVQMCNNEGGSAIQYSRLDYYGFDNKASSFYEDLPSGTVELFDNWYFANTLDVVIGDTLSFGANINDKASSVTAYF